MASLCLKRSHWAHRMLSSATESSASFYPSNPQLRSSVLRNRYAAPTTGSFRTVATSTSRRYPAPSSSEKASTSSSTPSTSSPSAPGTSSSTNSTPTASTSGTSRIQNISQTGLGDSLSTDIDGENGNGNRKGQVDWSRSFHGLSAEPFSKEAAAILLQPVDAEEVEIKPDGIVYLPEIKYRRILNKAFGPGGWGLVPRGESIVTAKTVTREYALVCHGRLVSIARGEQAYFSPDGIPTATEGCKSNAMMRCCKDLGVASELWDPRFIRKFRAAHTREVWVEHVVNKRKAKIWVRKDDAVQYPYKETR